MSTGSRREMIEGMSKKRSLFVLGLVAIALMLPLVLRGPFFYDLLMQAFLMATLASAWNIFAGYGGQFSIGHTVFFGLGAYTSTLFFVKLGISPWLGMLVGIAFSIVLCLLLSILFKLGGHFFALATLAVLFIFNSLAKTLIGLTGGAYGFMLPYKPDPKNFVFGSPLPYVYIAIGLLISVVYISYRTRHSKVGLFLIALREDEKAASSMGVNVFYYKLWALVLSAVITAIGGTLFAQYSLHITPDSFFNFELALDLIVYTILGGIGTISGPVIGAFLLTPIAVLLRGWIGGTYAELNYIIYGIILIVVMLETPGGITSWFARSHSSRKFIVLRRSDI
jgi:branched-chain amino acid transport system permease protein